jgi:hypothetical protein
MTMKMKHTPGPWTYLRMKLGPKQKDRRCGFVINGPDTGNPLPVRVCDLRVPAGIDGFGEGEANARLIAAAPELLAALQAVAAVTGEAILCDQFASAARDAIAKAQGGAP